MDKNQLRPNMTVWLYVALVAIVISAHRFDVTQVKGSLWIALVGIGVVVVGERLRHYRKK